MIKIHIDKKVRCEVECCGNFMDLAAEISYAINDIYHTIKASSSPQLAEQFRRVLSYSVGDPGSPVWTHTPDRTGKTGVCIIAEKRHGG